MNRELLRLAYVEEVMELAQRVQALIDEPNVQLIRSLKDTQDQLTRVEVALTAILVGAGASWSDMAAVHDGKSRQTLHYRLSKPAQQWVQSRTHDVGVSPRENIRLLKQRLSGRYRGLVTSVTALEEVAAKIDSSTEPR